MWRKLVQTSIVRALLMLVGDGFLSKLSENGVNRRLCVRRQGFADIQRLKITVEYPAWIGFGPFLKKKKQF